MTKSTKRTKAGFFNLRSVLTGMLCLSGVALAIVATNVTSVSRNPVKETGEVPERDIPVPGGERNEAKALGTLEQYWNDRLTYPTGKFNPAWLRAAADQHLKMQSALPAGSFDRLLHPAPIKVTKVVPGAKKGTTQTITTFETPQPLSLSTAGFTALGPQPLHMTGCTGCFDYGSTEGRINSYAVDPTTTTNGSIVAYVGTVGGGVWKTTNCCSSSTTWTSTTDDPLIAVTAIDTVTIDPNNHNTIYAGTGDLNYGSFSMGSQGILKSTNGGASWVVLGGNVFGPAYTEPAGQYPQYDSVGKVRVDPNNSNKVVAGTKKGLFFSYDGGNNWTGPCIPDSFPSQRQDITGLELTNISGVTRIIAAVGTRGFPTAVQYDLGLNGANGIYKGTMPASGCPSDFASITSNANGFVFGTAVTGSPYSTNANMNATSGVPCNYPITGGTATFCGGASPTNGGANNLGRIDIAVAPSDPNTIYAQVGSIDWNSDSSGSGGGGCASVAGCQLGAWYTTDGGTTWHFMTGSAGGSLQQCAATGNANNTQAGDYPQNWYDQGIAVDPNDSTKVFFDTHEVWFATQGGTVWYNTTCTYNQSSAIGMHADEHALAFVPTRSDILLAGGDGGPDATINANAAVLNTTRPTWFHMLSGLNTIEFYSGDISANFANAATVYAVGGAQDNAPETVQFTGSPTGPAQWQMGLGGDGFSGLVNSGGTGPNSAQGTITVTGAAVAGETFQVGSQLFTFQSGARAGTGQVQLSATTATEATNITSAILADVGNVQAVRSGSTVIVTADDGGATGNAITFTENVSNMTMNGAGTLGGTTSGGSVAGTTQPVFFQGNNSGGFRNCINNCWIGSPAATWTNKQGGWTGDTQQFSLPVHMFHGGIAGGDDCPNQACGHIVVGTTRVWETVTGQANQSNMSTIWYVTNNPATQNLSKATLGNRSYITQVKYSPKYSSVAIVSTNDGNVQIGFNMGAGRANQANWVNVTGGNAVLPNRPILGATLDPSVGAANTPVGYAAVGGFNANSPSTPGHVFQVTCAANCASSVWANKTGNLPDIPVDSVIVNPNYPQQVFAGTDWGVYFTNNIAVSSPTWYRFDYGLPHTMVWDMAVDRGSTTLSVWTRGRGAWVFPLTASDISPGPSLASAVSRQTHGGAGTFDLPLSTSSRTIEPRDGSGNFTIVMNYDQPVNTGTASVSPAGPTVSNVTFSGNSMIVSLTGVSDQQTYTVTCSNVGGPNSPYSYGSGSVQVGFLIGDVNQDGAVNVGDTIIVRSNSGATPDNTTFLSDVNLDGAINVGDTSIVRGDAGHGL